MATPQSQLKMLRFWPGQEQRLTPSGAVLQLSHFACSRTGHFLWWRCAMPALSIKWRAGPVALLLLTGKRIEKT